MSKPQFLWFLAATMILNSATLLAAGDNSKSKLQSSYELMSSENKAMQDDPSLNPAMFWVGDGEVLCNKPEKNNQSCASCLSLIHI